MSAAYQGGSPNARLLAGAMPEGEHGKGRFGGAFSVSVFSHVVGFLLLVYVVMHLPDTHPPPQGMFDTPKDIVWLAQEGPGGGGGGGGNRMPEPPRKAELPGQQKITVPVTKPPKLEAPKPREEKPKPVQEMILPAQVTAVGVQELPGMMSNVPALPSPSQGSGSQGGAGTGQGTGMGPGKGSGLGPGEGGGTGGGVYRPGNGVTQPRLINEVKPTYTADAMRAKIQGVVTLEAVVLPDGSVGPVNVTRSLDPTFGLDQEAIKTVRKWTFAPGTRFGQPVPVLVEIEMTFTLR